MADVVFLALHGACGEDGRVQAAFDLMDIPYTGSGYLGSAIAMDKDLTKRLAAADGVLTPKWRTAVYTPQEIEALTGECELPCVVKPVDSGSSIGVFIARDRAELAEALRAGISYAERYKSSNKLQAERSRSRSGRLRPALHRDQPKTAFTATKKNTSRARPWKCALRKSPRNSNGRWASAASAYKAAGDASIPAPIL